jgi:hypothetical protein
MFKDLMKNLVLFCAAIIFFLIIGEAITRIDNVRRNAAVEKFEYLPRPDGSPTVLGRNAFRKPLPEKTKPPGMIRIVALGDSYTWGDKLSDYKQLWTSVLEQELIKNAADKDIEVINLGIKGFTTVNELELFFSLGIKFSPDIVIVQYTLNDPLPSATHFRHAGEQALREANNIRNIFQDEDTHRFFSKSRFYSFLDSRFSYLQYRLSGKTRYDILYEEDYRPWKACKEALRMFSELGSKKDFKPVLMVFPVFYPGKWTEETYPLKHLHDRVVNTAKEYGFYTLDLLPVYIAQNKDFKSFRAMGGYDAHPGAEAHRLAGAALADFILENSLIRQD